MKVGDKVILTRQRYRCEGVVIETREAGLIHELVALGRGVALPTDGGLARAIAVRYEFVDNGTTITPVAILVQDAHGTWFDLYGRSVDVEPAANEQLQFGGAPAGNAYPD